jgi:hypothetical protein
MRYASLSLMLLLPLSLMSRYSTAHFLLKNSELIFNPLVWKIKFSRLCKTADKTGDLFLKNKNYDEKYDQHIGSRLLKCETPVRQSISYQNHFQSHCIFHIHYPASDHVRISVKEYRTSPNWGV